MPPRIGSVSFATPARRGSGLASALSVSLLLGLASTSCGTPPPRSKSPAAAREGETYRNPILFADWSDPDVIRVGEDFWLVASSFHEVPGLPVLHSKDLVHWELAGHAASRLPSPRYDVPRHGGGVWAPSIRHDGDVYEVWYGDPDLGLFVTRARDPRGPWEPLRQVREARGWIDPCPFRDTDGSRWVVHAWAKSRAGFNGVLTVRRLSPDGLSVVGEGVNVFDGGTEHPTIEGPKLYRRGEWVYIFAPAGGVKNGWQTVLRSKSVLGPYEGRIVLDQGGTPTNGPHQGGLVDTPSGEWWFVHFQDRGAYGRVTHLEPVSWRDGWPVIGEDPDGDGKGQPVAVFKRPDAGRGSASVAPQVSDEFDGTSLGPMWAWNANPRPDWASLTARPGFLRLIPVRKTEYAPASIAHQPNVLRTRLSSERLVATALVELNGTSRGAESGLAVLGLDVAYVAIARTENGWEEIFATGTGVLKDGVERVVERRAIPSGRLHLRVTVEPGARLRFATSEDGTSFTPIGGEVVAREGAWVGARLALFTRPLPDPEPQDVTDVAFFRVE
ncbi:MAG: glycoside hydrolase 43 family protein [Thermoanaerobaculia bacterium]|nr:glycoside hydrolase 43 family protein [Thermoanaerobaculia bacterium]